jgi:7-cyano-7-deazaguanine synthase
MKTDTLVMLSGGLDSTVLVYQLTQKENRNISGIYYNLGRKPQIREIASHNQLAIGLNFPIETVDLTGLDKIFHGHLSYKAMQSAEADVDPFGPRIAVRLVRLGGFASLMTMSAFYAHAIGVDRVGIGILDIQAATYPGFPEFREKLSEALNILQKGLPKIEFYAPFENMSKSSVIELGQQLGVPFEKTWSCFEGNEFHCGICSACEQRKVAFKQAGVDDPTIYSG